MQGRTLRVCTMGDEVNPCVACMARPCRRSKGVSVAYDPDDTTATHCLLLQEIQIGFGFTFLVLAHPGSPRQNPEGHKTVVVVETEKNLDGK